MNQIIISIFLILSLSRCSTFGKFLYRTEYASKLETKINIDTYTKKPKVFIIKTECYLDFCSEVNTMILEKLKTKNIEIVENANEANYIVSFDLESISEVNAGTARILKNYLTADLLYEKFILDSNNNIHEIPTKQNYSIGQTIAEQTDMTKIGRAPAFGAGIGYLASHSIKGAGIGAATALPLAVVAEASTRSTGLFLSINFNLIEMKKDKIKFSRKILDKTSQNAVDEAFYNHEKNLINHKTRAIVIAVTSIYNIEKTNQEMFKIAISQLINSTFSDKRD